MTKCYPHVSHGFAKKRAIDRFSVFESEYSEGIGFLNAKAIGLAYGDPQTKVARRVLSHIRPRRARIDTSIATNQRVYIGIQQWAIKEAGDKINQRGLASNWLEVGQGIMIQVAL
ncbi:hypothetical protein ACJX0J_025764 [Zea mays]